MLVVGEDVVIESLVCLNFPVTPGDVPAVSQLHPGSVPQLCGLWHPCRSRRHLHQVPRTRTRKKSLLRPLGATTNWAAPSFCCCRARGHLGDTSVPVGRGEQWGNRGRGATGESGSPEGPEQAQPWLLPALFIAGTAMCRTCAAARAGAGVSPGCAALGCVPVPSPRQGPWATLSLPLPTPWGSAGTVTQPLVTRLWG